MKVLLLLGRVSKAPQTKYLYFKGLWGPRHLGSSWHCFKWGISEQTLCLAVVWGGRKTSVKEHRKGKEKKTVKRIRDRGHPLSLKSVYVYVCVLVSEHKMDSVSLEPRQSIPKPLWASGHIFPLCKVKAFQGFFLLPKRYSIPKIVLTWFGIIFENLFGPPAEHLFATGLNTVTAVSLIVYNTWPSVLGLHMSTLGYTVKRDQIKCWLQGFTDDQRQMMVTLQNFRAVV